MKSKLKILVLILGCTMLTACPPGNYSEYSPVNADLNRTEFGYSYTVNENLEFKVKAGTYYSFVKSLESGISASFHFDRKEQKETFTNLNIKVFSRNYGALELLDQVDFNQIAVHQRKHSMIFGAKLEKKDFKRTRSKNDTIFIELDGNRTLEFTRTE